MKIGQKGSGGAFPPDQGATKERVCACSPASLVLALSGGPCVESRPRNYQWVILTDGQSVMCVGSQPDGGIGLPRLPPFNFTSFRQLNYLGNCYPLESRTSPSMLSFHRRQSHSCILKSGHSGPYLTTKNLVVVGKFASRCGY